MDPAVLSATSALVGSLMGGFSTFCASWVTQRRQVRSQLLLQQAAKRETLYAEFIMEATKRLTEAWSKQPEEPDVLAGLYAAMERMRLISSSNVIETAEHVIRTVVEAYADPNRTFNDLRKGLMGGNIHLDNPLKEFTDACKAELALHI
jgi:arginine deiminase